jgi:hypothetical protein
MRLASRLREVHGRGLPDGGQFSSDNRPRHPAMALQPRRFDQAHASCMTVDAATMTELRGLARGRILLIDYFCVVGRRGAVLGDVKLRWLIGPDELPREAARVDDVPDVPVFIMPELAPLMVAVGGRLAVAGPRWAPVWRHPVITIMNGEPWVDFFEGRAIWFGRRP